MMFNQKRKQTAMKHKTEADISAEIKKLNEQKKKIIVNKKIAYADGIAKAIKARNLNPKTINEALDQVVTSKKERALLGLSDLDDQSSQGAMNKLGGYK